MMGTGTFAEPTFEALLAAFGGDVVGLVTQPERDGGNKRGCTRQTGKGMANIAQGRRARAPIAQPEASTRPKGWSNSARMKPDLLVVAAYGQILSKDVLADPDPRHDQRPRVAVAEVPRRGPGRVRHPQRRDADRRDDHQDDARPRLRRHDPSGSPRHPARRHDRQRWKPASRRSARSSRWKWCGSTRPAGRSRGEKQDPALVTKAPKIKKEFGLIDWTKPADYIERFVRAMQPWPTAYTFHHRPATSGNWQSQRSGSLSLVRYRPGKTRCR